MPILIKLADQLDSSYAIIELQGDLKSSGDASYESQYVGDLHFTKTGTPLLIIGHHLLLGKEMPLDHPLALLKREKSDDDTEFVVQTIVTKKIIFKHRPKPIVGM